MEKQDADVRCKYFDIVAEFGLHRNNHSSMFSKTQALSISLSLPGRGRTTCYGDTAEEVCRIALEWLEANGWKSPTEKMTSALIGVTSAITNTLTEVARPGFVPGRSMEVVFHPETTALNKAVC